MPFFPLISLQDMALAFFLGLVTFILLYVAWASYPPGGFEPSRRSGSFRRCLRRRIIPCLPFLFLFMSVWRSGPWPTLFLSGLG